MRLRIGSQIVLVAVFVLWLASSAFPQNGCVALPDVSFFVDEASSKVLWSDEEMEGVIAAQRAAAESERAQFFIPPIIAWLSAYKPGCGPADADRRFERLLTLYFAIRGQETSLDSSSSAVEKLRLVKDDFGRQLNDDQLFRKLIYTTDDGPLSGKQVSPRGIKAVAKEVRPTPFGSLTFANLRNGVAMMASGKNGKPIWARVLTGTVPARNLKKADLQTMTVEHVSFVVVARLSVDGERLTLYVRPDGRFMYYMHSW